MFKLEVLDTSATPARWREAVPVWESEVGTCCAFKANASADRAALIEGAQRLWSEAGFRAAVVELRTGERVMDTGEPQQEECLQQ